MFEALKKRMSATNEVTIGDAIIAEAGNGEFEAENFIMEACTKIKEEDDSFDDDSFDDDYFFDLDEAGCKRKAVKEEAEVAQLVESIPVDADDDAANDYLDSIASISDDSEIEGLVNSIPVDTGDSIDLEMNDDELDAGATDIPDPTMEELADELFDEEI